ncbi:MAG: OmpH family outer membrane protein [Prevotella sp.]|jgi:outer membrane protein|nr:OmpH family outer membrane protein [Prevotella sp.]
MKKYIFSALAIAAMMVSCNKQSAKMDEQPAAGETSASGLKIAYVEVDSLMTQYDFAKDYSVTLQKKSNNARNTLTTKGNALQAAVNNFQQKLNNNGFTSREQAASQQAAIERQQRDLQELQARLENELANETAKFNETLRDSLQSFLKDYNKDKQFSLILTKQGDNILLADKKYDITQDVINGLNKRYKPAVKADADKKADEKK